MVAVLAQNVLRLCNAHVWYQAEPIGLNLCLRHSGFGLARYSKLMAKGGDGHDEDIRHQPFATTGAADEVNIVSRAAHHFRFQINCGLVDFAVQAAAPVARHRVANGLQLG